MSWPQANLPAGAHSIETDENGWVKGYVTADGARVVCVPNCGQIKPNNQAKPGPIGNTQGIIVPQTATASGANSAPQPTGKGGGWWSKWGEAVHLGLDALGLIPIVGEAFDGINAAIYLAEGDYVNAALSAAAMVPVGGQAATTAKVAKRGADAVQTTAKAAKTTGKGARATAKGGKEAAEKTVEKTAGKGGGGKGNDGGKVKKKKKEKLKCGDAGSYGKMKQKTGGGKFDRDHIPSKAALKARAEKLKGEPLTKNEIKAIDKAGDTIAIPREAHKDISPTYGQTLEAAARDAEDLAGSAKRDIDAMLDKIDEYDADGGCKKAYKKAAGQILKKNNKDFDKWLVDVMKNARKK